MKALHRRKFALQIGVTMTGLFTLLLCYSPIFILINDAYAQTAPAATPENAQAWWQAALVPVLSTLGLFVAAFVGAGLRKLVQLIEKKWSVDIPDSLERMMYDKARWAIGWAEEQAERRLLYGDGEKTPGAEKAEQVVKMLEDFANKLGVSEEWRKEKIQNLADGVLHLEREVSVGSNGSRGKKLEEKKNGEG